MLTKSLLNLGTSLKTSTLEKDPWTGEIEIEILSADDPDFQDWMTRHAPSPAAEFSRKSAAAGVRLGRGRKKGKGGRVNKRVLEQAAEQAASEVDWTSVHDVEDVKEGIAKLFRLKEDDSEKTRLEMLTMETDVCFPAATREVEDEAGNVVAMEDVWQLNDVEECDTEIPFGGEGTHPSNIKVARPSVPNCIAVWIWTVAHDRAKFRADQTVAAAEELDPTPDGSTESEAA